jgi:hypothetical protein
LVNDKLEAEAQVFVAENEPLLERAAPATLHRIILHGSEIATRLSAEVVEEMESRATTLNTLAQAINNPDTPPVFIQKLEERRMALEAGESTKQDTFERLSDLIDRAITLREEREELPEMIDVPEPDIPGFKKPTVKAKPGFWRRLFGG